MDAETILCYARKSWVPDGSTTISPEMQCDAIRGIVEPRGFRCEWYIDAEGHRSGLSEVGRPEWLRLKANLSRPDVAGVAAYDLSRIYRNVSEFLQFIDMLEKRKQRLMLFYDFIDTGSAAGRMLATVLVAMYEMEARRTSERVTENIDYRRRHLGKHWGTIPFGCIRVDGVLGIDRDTIYVLNAAGEWVERPYHKALQTAYEAFATGTYTYDSLTEYLNTDGWRFKDRHGQPREWTRDDVRRILAAWRLYGGDLPLGRQKDGVPVEIIAGAHDPIIDTALCRQVGEQIAARHRPATRPSLRRSYLLTGVLHCAHCGKPLRGNAEKGTPYYRHEGAKSKCPEILHLEATTLNDQVVAWIETLYTPALAERVEAAIAATLTPEVRAAQREITRLQDHLSRLLETYVAGEVQELDYHRKHHELYGRITILQDQLPPDALEIRKKLIRFRDLTTDLHTLSHVAQKRIIADCFTSLDISGKCITRVIPSDWLAPLWLFVERTAKPKP